MARTGAPAPASARRSLRANRDHLRWGSRSSGGTDGTDARSSQTDRLHANAITPTRQTARLLAVETDHPAVRGAVIAFVTERSSGGGSPGASFWVGARVEPDRG